MVPEPHGVGMVAASGHAWPSGQDVQPVCVVSPVPLPYRPYSQGAAFELTLPSSQK